jgi:hypothetical protein
MKSTPAWSLAVFAFALLAACGGEGSGATGSPSAVSATTSAAPTTSAAATATSTATAAPTTSAAATATDTASAAPTTSAAAAGTTSAAPAGSGTATAAAKKFDCGEKGQKACPMQGWMKSAMGSAVASGDGEKIAKALETVARKPVAGMGQWSAIAIEGAGKARAGDIDGAKQSCKKCHDLYKYKYQTTLRDQPW